VNGLIGKKDNRQFQVLQGMLEICRIPTRWWSFVIWGLILLAIGIITLLRTDLVMSIIALLFSALVFLIGIILVVICIFASRNNISWWPLLFSGLFFIFLGILSAIAPGLLATIAIILIAALTILIGLLIIGYGMISFAELATRVLVILLGIIPLAIGVYMILHPGIAAVFIVDLWGIFAIIIGIALVVQGLTLKRVKYNFGCDEDTGPGQIGP
jgi:uncharacterized membrane protein HdeD (DUF308 family)